MPDFNPDEYLKNNTFNPDEYLKQSTPKTSEEKQKTSVIEAGLTGFAKGATFGLNDEIQGGLGALNRVARYAVGNEPTATGYLDALKSGYTSSRDAQRYYQKQLENEHPIADFAGQISSAIPSLFAKGAMSLGSMAAQGGLSGYGNSEKDNLSGQLQDTATGTAVGYGLGKAGELVGAGLGKVGGLLDNIKNKEALKALGAQKSQMKRLGGEYGDDVAQYAIDNGLINPLKNVSNKQEIASNLQSKIGDKISEIRSKLPDADTYNVKDAITNKMDFNPDLGINADLTKQLTTVSNDLDALAKDGKINMKDLLDYKAQLFNLSRKSNGEINPAKDVLETARQGIGSYEQKLANSPGYSSDLKDYSKIKNIQNLLENKAAMASNSLLGMGGMIGGGAGITASTVTGDPKYLALAALGSPAIRSRLGETAALGVNAVQKITPEFLKNQVALGKLSPKVAQYILNQKLGND